MIPPLSFRGRRAVGACDGARYCAHLVMVRVRVRVGVRVPVRGGLGFRLGLVRGGGRDRGYW